MYLDFILYVNKKCDGDRYMKMYDKINDYRKEYVYEQYMRIVDNIKDYDKITRTKMLDAIYDIYSDFNNIIDICTIRELKYLKMVLDNDLTLDDVISSAGKKRIKYLDHKYDWERKTLKNKFLLISDFYDESYVPEEIEKSVRKALKNVKLNEKKKIDELNELMIGYCKAQGIAILDSVVNFVSGIVDLDENFIFEHVANNRLFNYYVLVIEKDIENLGDNIPVAIHYDYSDIVDELEIERRKQGIAGTKKFNLSLYSNLFYYDFDIDNPKIKIFLEELNNLLFYFPHFLWKLRKIAMLNIDRKPLKKYLFNILESKNSNLTDFLIIMDEAMDEMPSGALNGFSPNEAKEILAQNILVAKKKEERYVKQQGACLSKKDVKLFFKLYFALLEFTNDKFNIVPGLKIYNKVGLNPALLDDIIAKFWKQKDALLFEFCIANPYKFNKEEIDIVKEFRKGFRGNIIVVKYEKEYTVVLADSKFYMIKGLNDNIDNCVSYKRLPYPGVTAIMPFKDVLIYDGMILGMNVDFSNEVDEMLERESETSMRYYYL